MQMREIKFEVWDTHLNTMQKDAHLYHEFIRYLADDRYKKRQFIGLTDYLYTEIYEGDLMDLDDTEDTTIIEVVFHKGAFMKKFYEDGKPYLTDDTKQELITPFDAFDLANYRVIGNIYQNPDLCK